MQRDPAAAANAAAKGLLVLVLGGVYVWSLLPGPGHSHDTAEMQFAAPLLCVTHPTGSPTYLLLGHAFSRLVPFGTPAYRINLLSALFGVLAGLVVRRLLRRLGAREAVAWSIAVALGLTPNLWRFSVVGEVYSLNLLFVALVSDALVKWRQTSRDRDLLVACAWYVLSFGNHLTMILVLPAFVVFVLMTRWRVLLEWRLVAAVGGMILLGLAPYAYPILRSLDPDTPYLYTPVTNLAELRGYATGAEFHQAMLTFTTPRQLVARLPLFLPLLWRDCAPLLPLAVLGLLVLDGVTIAYLVLVSLGHLVFALGFDGGDIDNYYLPIYFATAVLAGLGLERLLGKGAGRRAGRRLPAALCLLLPLALGAWNRGEVERLKRPELATPMHELLDATRARGLIVAGYNDYVQLLYFTLAEKKGGPWVFVGHEVTVPEIAAYLRDDQPIYLKPLRKWAPPGLPVYCTRLDMRPRLRAAGLFVQMWRPGVFRIDRHPLSGGKGSSARRSR